MNITITGGREMTTPEQLATWREDADIVFQKILLTEYKNLSRAKRDKGEMFKYFEFTTESVWRAFEIGYIRAKQDNEQALKDARKQALEEAIAMFCYPDVLSSFSALSTVEKKIKELLK